jgi:hexosaminidase
MGVGSKRMVVRGLAALVLVALAGTTLMAMPAGAAALVTIEATSQFAAGARLQVRWELERNEFTAAAPYGRSTARLSVTNLDNRPLPAQGWAIYFNCMARVKAGPLESGLAIDHMGGDLFRLRPGPGFGGLAPGQVLQAVYRHPGAVSKLYKAPAGLYLVYDAAPDVTQAIDDYKLMPVTRPEQLDKGAGNAPLVTAQDLYRRNAQADLLPAAALPPVFPTPLQLQAGQGSLHLDGAPPVFAAAALKNEAGFARELLQQYWPAAGAKASVAGAPALRLALGRIAGQDSPEAYTLAVDAAGIAITGNSASGVARGLQSLRDLLPLPAADGATAAGVDLPMLTITDAPRFAYRGFQLDVSRNFQSKQTVFRLLDLMARFKLNAFHFHLTDDEGWRLEIAGLPELTSIGAVRGHSTRPGVRLPPAYGSGGGEHDPHGSGYYSRADYIEIVRYAAARHIDVIPEIEMPGHARAAVRAMEARYRRMKAAGLPGADRYLLNDFDDRSVYRSPQDYNDHVMNPGLESSYAFIEHVVKQVAVLHRAAGVPLRTVHVGADELPDGAWEKSPLSRAMMARHKLETTADLWDLFFDRVDGILRKQGLYASGWEELGARKTMLRGESKLIPNPRFTQRGFSVYVWNNTEGAEDFAYRLANAGYDAVLAPVTKMYLDMGHNQNPEEPGVNWGGYVELDTVYDFIPLDYMKNADPPLVGKDSLTDYGKRHIRGLEATLFTETVRDPSRLDYMIMPRLLAMAERAWAPDPAWATEADPAKAAALHRSAWSGFVNVLGQRVLPRLDLERWPAGPVAYRIAPPGLMIDGGKVYANHALPGLALRYTSDGSEPVASSPLVQGAIADRGLIQAAAFDRNGRRGGISRIDNR